MLVRFNDNEQLSPLTMLCNTGAGGVFSNVRANLARGYRKFVECKAGTRTAVLCASGPSLADTLESIKAMQKRGAFVIAMNGTGRFLVENGVKPDALALVDPRPENIEFVSEAWAPEAWLGSQCHPDVSAKAEEVGMRVILWHPGVPGIQKHIPASDSLRMGGGHTIGLCAISCAYVAGFREIHLFGYDSSHKDDRGHAFKQARNADDETMTAVVDSRVFTCSTVMATQASEFLEFTKHLLKDGVELHVHGDGLLPTLWRSEQRKKGLRVLAAAYDLGVSPPTYDFISFLAEAERHRVANNFDVIDLSFQPGPMNGFRHDELPPEAATRDGMLWRVCIGIARLLPSVRNVAVLRERELVAEHVFPEGWASDKPVSRYGAQYQRDAETILRASEFARKWAGGFPERMATITLRQSAYWPQRNSNLAAWREAAAWLLRQGIWTVFIPEAGVEFKADSFSVCMEAAFDVDLRAALYERAVINLGVSNGPLYLAPVLDARYLIFNVGDGSTHSTSTEFLLAHGIARGDTTVFGGNGKAVWEPDNAEVILRELAEFDQQLKEKTS